MKSHIPLWIYTVIILLVIWQLYASFSTGMLSIPSVGATLASLWGMIIDGRLISALLVSLQGLVIGFLLSVIIGVPLGLMMGYSSKVDRALVIYIDILTAVPMVSIIPLVVVFFGLGLSARIVIVFLFSIVLVVENTKTGVKQTDASLLEMAHSFGASKRQKIRKILLPSAIPFMAAGMRLALGRAIVGMVTGEMILSSVGIGFLLMNASGSFKAAEVFSIVLALLILSALLILAVQRIENRLLEHRK